MRRFFVSLFLFLFFLVFSPMLVSFSAADATVLVNGRVMSSDSGKPFSDALVVVERVLDTALWREYVSAYTDSDGYFKLRIPFSGKSRIFALFDDKATPGVDYLPGFAEVTLEHGKTYDISFRLIPGASLRFNVDAVSFVEEPNPQERRFQFEVLPIYEASNLTGCLLQYGSQYGISVGLDPGHVVIPSGQPVILKLDAIASISYPSQSSQKRIVSHRFILDDAGRPFVLTEGDLLNIDIRARSLEYNLNSTRSFILGVSEMLVHASEEGFYLSEERNRLDRAGRLLDSARVVLSNSSFYECYAYLRQAYIMISNIQYRITMLYTAASAAAIALVPFLAMNSLAVAFMLFERTFLKKVFFLLLFTLMFGVANTIFVGFKVVDYRLILIDTLLCGVGGVLLPKFSAWWSSREPEQTNRMYISLSSLFVSIFSIAKRNLRRHRFKTLLVTVSLTLLVSCFIVLTSIELEQGFLIYDVKGFEVPPSDGVLVRKIPPRDWMPLPNLPISRISLLAIPFLPLETSVIDWLSNREEVKLLAPKVESQPSLGPIFGLVSRRGSADERIILMEGALGIVPTAEVQVTFIDRIIKEGSFLKEDHDIIISEKAALELGVKVGDILETISEGFTEAIPKLYSAKSGRKGTLFRLVGTFDATRLRELYDLDGAPVVPKKLEVISEPMEVIYTHCDPNRVAIFTLSSALTLPSMVLARVDVLVRDSSDILPLSRLMTLNLGVNCWASIAKRILYHYIGEHLEIKGFSLLVPFLLTLGNIFMVMLNSVHERKKEIFTMTTIGLNPSHVSAIFIAEGLIIGFIGGGFGYILSLGSYRLMSLLHMQVEVYQKVSIGWSLLALAFSVGTTVLGTIIPALRASLLSTPSLTRRWNLEDAIEKERRHWRIHLPVSIHKKEVDSFTRYLHSELRDFENPEVSHILIWRLRDVKYSEATDGSRRLGFTFVGYLDASPYRHMVSMNEILIAPSSDPDLWTACLLYYGTLTSGLFLFKNSADAHALASFGRKIILGWKRYALD